VWPRGWAFAEGIGCEVLFNDVHSVVGAPNHPLANESTPSWLEASAHPWLLPPAGTALRRCIDDTFIAAGLVPSPAWIESSAIATDLSRVLTSEPGAFGMVWHASGVSPGMLCALQALRQTAADMVPGEASCKSRMPMRAQVFAMGCRYVAMA